MFWIGLAVFLLVDAIVLIVVLKRVLEKRGGLGGLDLAALARFARESHEEVGAYLRANYGGDSSSLPRVMQGLVDSLEQRARDQRIALDRAMLKQLAERSAAAHKVAKPRELEAAMTHVS